MVILISHDLASSGVILKGTKDGEAGSPPGTTIVSVVLRTSREGTKRPPGLPESHDGYGDSHLIVRGRDGTPVASAEAVRLNQLVGAKSTDNNVQGMRKCDAVPRRPAAIVASLLAGSFGLLGFTGM